MTMGQNRTENGAGYELYGFEDDRMVVVCYGSSKRTPSRADILSIAKDVFPGAPTHQLRVRVVRDQKVLMTIC